MPHRTPLEDLLLREYLTPKEAARVFGRGEHFWRVAYDRHHVGGYQHKGRRYLIARYCREYLEAGGPENQSKGEGVINWIQRSKTLDW